MDMVQQRRPVLAFIFFFDLAVYVFRLIIKRAADSTGKAIQGLFFQMGNMLALYAVVTTFNWRLKRAGICGGAQVCMHLPLACCAQCALSRADQGKAIQGPFFQKGNMLALKAVAERCRRCWRASSGGAQVTCSCLLQPYGQD